MASVPCRRVLRWFRLCRFFMNTCLDLDRLTTDWQFWWLEAVFFAHIIHTIGANAGSIKTSVFFSIPDVPRVLELTLM